MDPDHALIAGNQAVLALEAVAAFAHLGESGEDALAVIRMKHLREESGIGHPRARRVPDKLFDLGADVRRALAGELLDIGDLRELLDEHSVPALRRSQVVLEEHPRVRGRGLARRDHAQVYSCRCRVFDLVAC